MAAATPTKFARGLASPIRKRVSRSYDHSRGLSLVYSAQKAITSTSRMMTVLDRHLKSKNVAYVLQGLLIRISVSF